MNCLHITAQGAATVCGKYRNDPLRLINRLRLEIERIEYLLDMGANYKQLNFNGQTPLDLIPLCIKQEIINYVELIELR